jgi:simple sugar transport system permease protein
LGVIFSSVFLRFIDKGGYNLAGFTAYNEYVSDLIIAVIIYFAGFSKLIKDMLSRRKAKASEVTAKPEENDEKKEEENK